MQPRTSAAYGPTVQAILNDAPINALGPGVPGVALRPVLEAMTPETLASPGRLKNRDLALACCAGLWLRCDFFDESHGISQNLETPAGSYWHGILHRREPDYGNAKYWFRQVGVHPIFAALHAAVIQLAAQAVEPLVGQAETAVRGLLSQPNWDPFRFVDLCQTAAAGPPPLAALCMRIQQCEWELLFDDCYRQAVAP